MLSKKERNFLRNPEIFSGASRRYLRWRIRRKLKMLNDDLATMLSACDKSGIGKQEILDAIELQGQKEMSQNSATKAFDNSNTSENSQTPANQVQKTDDVLAALENW